MRRAWLAAAVLAAGWVRLMRPVSLRAGLPNENSFGFFAVNVGSLARMPPSKMAEVGDKELSPLLYRALTGRSLKTFVRAQQVLWVLGALLVYLALARFGVRPALAACAAAVWLTSFLSAITAHSLGSGGIVVVFTLAAVWALSADRLALFAVFGLLTFLGRFEFLPPLLLGLALRRKELEKKAGPWSRVVFLLATAAALSWALAITRTGRARTEGAAPGNFIWNLAYHLGTQNLTLSLGVPALACVAFTFAALALGAWRTRKEKDRQLAALYWLCAGWIVWFCAIYAPTSPYLLFNARHHLYFFVPFALLFGCLAELAARRLPRVVPVCAALTAVFAFMNARTTFALQNELRTHDLEWRFLYDAQRDFPEACRVVSPGWDPRRALLSRLFPTAPAGSPRGCLLVYRSAFAQALDAPGRFPEHAGLLYTAPWREQSWPHRFYTNYGMIADKLEDAPGRERREPFQVTVGFYQLPEPVRVFAAADARLIAASERRDDAPAALSEAGDLLKRAAKKDRELWRAWDASAEARLLCDRGVLEAVSGDKKSARRDLTAAVAFRPAFLPAYLSLGELEAGDGHVARARILFDEALSAKASPSDEEAMRALIADARKRLGP